MGLISEMEELKINGFVESWNMVVLGELRRWPSGVGDAVIARSPSASQSPLLMSYSPLALAASPVWFKARVGLFRELSSKMLKGASGSLPETCY